MIKFNSKSNIISNYLVITLYESYQELSFLIIFILNFYTEQVYINISEAFLFLILSKYEKYANMQKIITSNINKKYYYIFTNLTKRTKDQ